MDDKRTIMVVDDEEPIRYLLGRTLAAGGYKVVNAPDGETALELFRKREPGLVILDIRMPGLSGFQVLTEIRRCSNIPVLMLTGMDNVEYVRDTLALGADDYIRKPFSTLELLARVKAKLRRSSSN